MIRNALVMIWGLALAGSANAGGLGDWASDAQDSLKESVDEVEKETKEETKATKTKLRGKKKNASMRLKAKANKQLNKGKSRVKTGKSKALGRYKTKKFTKGRKKIDADTKTETIEAVDKQADVKLDEAGNALDDMISDDE